MIGKLVERCLVSWGISKVFTITVDNASANDVGLRFLKRRLKSWGTSLLDGEFLHMRCGAHILNLVVKDGLDENKDKISRIRAAVRYVRSSPGRLNKFKECILHLRLSSTAGVCLDVETRWNSTYLMLESAVKLKKGFDMLELEDDKYVVELGKLEGVPTEADWDYAKTYTPILKFFYDATLRISATRYVTGNLYLKDIFGVGLMIRKLGLNKADPNQKAMAIKMKAKFDKYWGDMENMNLVIFLACVIDPRYKMKYVSWLIRESYGVGPNSIAEALIMKINSVLEKMFKLYEDKVSGSSMQTEGPSEVVSEAAETYDLDSLIDIHEESEDNTDGQSELESYLADACVPRSDPKFDILLWWKKTGSKYKILSLMARDLLAIPVSTVASESAFSTSGRVIDPFRSSLTPRLVEALICTQDWIRNDYEQSLLEEEIEQLEILEEEFVTSNAYGNLVQGVGLALEEE
ncbi:Ribonuclease H-like superfamily [Arabidopsis thaliana x Arabidopsis arenosa]|uniref:Ribonuclease H-like superfamily n=1 Tax=Arabidopsis thaliana x Arabidopsis arenosa TaxID=1240361 RepID=A0A8T1YZU2_9BRAS|nr:Ribonuclease H-like superfamily [Arabidopsis thaliana x Arabidopsis arenosa]